MTGESKRNLINALKQSSGQDAEQAQDRLVQFTAEVVPDGIWFTSAQDLAKQLAEALLAG